MAGQRLDDLTLTEAEKSELTVMVSRPKTAQDWRSARGSCLRAPRAMETRGLRAGSMRVR